jgi:hypothetical protein
VPHAIPEGELEIEPVPLPDRVTDTASSATAKENGTLTGVFGVLTKTSGRLIVVW